MTTDDHNSKRRPPASAWARHAGAAAAAVVLNVALVVFLSAWSRPSGPPARPATLAVPLEVVDLPAEEMEIVPSEPPAHAAPAEPPPVERPLPTPRVPEMPAPSVRLEVPARAGMDAVAIPEVPPELPEFAALPVVAPPARVGPVVPTPKPRPPRKVALSRGPMLLQPPDLSDYYPRRARMRAVTGRTTVRLTVSAEGRVTDVAILASTPEGIFEIAARRVSRTLRFRPALRDNRPVPAVVSLNLIWKLED